MASIYYNTYRAGFLVGEVALELGVTPPVDYAPVPKDIDWDVVDYEALNDAYLAGIGDGVAGYDPATERQIDIWMDSDYAV